MVNSGTGEGLGVGGGGYLGIFSFCSTIIFDNRHQPPGYQFSCLLCSGEWWWVLGLLQSPSGGAGGTIQNTPSKTKLLVVLLSLKSCLGAMIFFSNGWLLSQNHPYAHPPSLPLCSSHVYYSEIKKRLRLLEQMSSQTVSYGSLFCFAYLFSGPFSQSLVSLALLQQRLAVSWIAWNCTGQGFRV